MTYVMADIHGNLQRFNSIMEQIKFTEDDHLYVLGDVIDRFPDGIQILQKLFRMKNATVLLGNHEQLMLRAVWLPADISAIKHWYQNGGQMTHKAWLDLTPKEKMEIILGFQKCPLNTEIKIREETYLLCHGSPLELFDEETSEWPSPVFHTIWERIKPQDEMPQGKTVIFGHCPTGIYQPIQPMALWYGDRKIGIDCGAGYAEYGRLCCLRLDDMKVFYSTEAE